MAEKLTFGNWRKVAYFCDNCPDVELVYRGLTNTDSEKAGLMYRCWKCEKQYILNKQYPHYVKSI